jgi:hypothetical protein
VVAGTGFKQKPVKNVSKTLNVYSSENLRFPKLILEILPTVLAVLNSATIKAEHHMSERKGVVQLGKEEQRARLLMRQMRQFEHLHFIRFFLQSAFVLSFSYTGAELVNASMDSF